MTLIKFIEIVLTADPHMLKKEEDGSWVAYFKRGKVMDPWPFAMWKDGKCFEHYGADNHEGIPRELSPIAFERHCDFWYAHASGWEAQWDTSLR